MTALSEVDPTGADVPEGDERVSCEHAERCGGCPLIGLSYAQQLDLKRARVMHAMAAYPALALVATEPVAPAHPRVGYRTRAKLIVGAGGRIGLFARGGGHHLVDVPRCRVLSPTLARVASVMRSLVSVAEQSGGVLVPFEGSERGCLRGIDLREILDGGVARALVTFVVQSARVPSIERLQEAARALMREAPEVVGVGCNFHEGDSPQALGSRTTPLAGASAAPDRIGASTHHATFGSFVQAHRGQAAHVHAVLVAALELGGVNAGRPRVLDLYGGSGAIALGLAAAGASVRLIESFGPAVAQAR
ncbi:MAG: RNA methyltransferase, partial [Myxococcota bacterium]|nr:RNA methyltransferase [Myxococcota bacterium]